MFRSVFLAVLAACSLAAQIRINAGGPALTDDLGRAWSADQGSIAGTTLYSVAGQKGIYSTLRYGTTLHYDIPTDPAQQQLWWIRLHFLEPTVTKSGQRVFDVWVDNTRMLANVDLAAQAGYQKPYAVSMVVDSAKN